MAKKLIIAEKPSVAADIARALGGFVRKGDYFESDHYVLSSAVGHLLELTLPEKYDVKRGKWSFTRLPVIPPHFDLAPIEKSETRLNLLLRLMKRKDVTGLVNACDAGREGELIFRYIMRHASSQKPVQRLWLQSMTPASIRQGFDHDIDIGRSAPTQASDGIKRPFLDFHDLSDGFEQRAHDSRVCIGELSIVRNSGGPFSNKGRRIRHGTDNPACVRHVPRDASDRISCCDRNEERLFSNDHGKIGKRLIQHLRLHCKNKNVRLFRNITIYRSRVNLVDVAKPGQLRSVDI